MVKGRETSLFAGQWRKRVSSLITYDCHEIKMRVVPASYIERRNPSLRNIVTKYLGKSSFRKLRKLFFCKAVPLITLMHKSESTNAHRFFIENMLMWLNSCRKISGLLIIFYLLCSYKIATVNHQSEGQF